MMVFKKAIPRRTFLQGAGISLALPLLDGMVPAFAAAGSMNPSGKPPLRISIIYGPNGRIMNAWTPRQTGSNYELSRTLTPLAAFRDQMLVISGLNIKAADAVGNEPGGVHARPCACFLTGVHPQPNNALAPSIDQLIARESGKDTQLGSLELTMESSDILGKADGSYSDAYTKTISWRTATTPLPMENNPRKVFERLLGDNSSTDSAKRLRIAQDDRSVLDSLTEAVSRLSGALNAADKVKLAEYLDATRDIERRIQLAEQQASRELPTINKPAGVPSLYSEHAALLFDLQLLAFRADLTRVSTFMWGMEQGEGDYREIGVPDGHHSTSHHAGVPEHIENGAKIDSFHSTLFAKYLEMMRSIPDGDGTLLDHSLVLYGSGLGDGNTHDHNGIPLILAGGANGQLKGGRHVVFPGLPFSNVHLNILEMTGIPVDRYLDPKYGDATEKLDLLSL